MRHAISSARKVPIGRYLIGVAEVGVCLATVKVEVRIPGEGGDGVGRYFDKKRAEIAKTMFSKDY